jgi:hypothetical protein
MDSGRDSITLPQQAGRQNRKSTRQRHWSKSRKHALSARRKYWPAPCGPLTLTSIRGRCAPRQKSEKRTADVINAGIIGKQHRHPDNSREERVSPMTHEKVTLLLAQATAGTGYNNTCKGRFGARASSDDADSSHALTLLANINTPPSLQRWPTRPS